MSSRFPPEEDVTFEPPPGSPSAATASSCLLTGLRYPANALNPIASSAGREPIMRIKTMWRAKKIEDGVSNSAALRIFLIATKPCITAPTVRYAKRSSIAAIKNTVSPGSRVGPPAQIAHGGDPSAATAMPRKAKKSRKWIVASIFDAVRKNSESTFFA